MKTNEFEIRIINPRMVRGEMCLMLRLTTHLREKGWQYPIVLKEGISLFVEAKKGEKVLIETFEKYKQSLTCQN